MHNLLYVRQAIQAIRDGEMRTLAFTPPAGDIRETTPVRSIIPMLANNIISVTTVMEAERTSTRRTSITAAGITTTIMGNMSTLDIMDITSITIIM